MEHLLDPEDGDNAFRSVPRTGVIYVMTEASRRGYRGHDPSWVNLGQGMPETGPLPGAPPRLKSLTIEPDDQEYAPIQGLPELREAVADHYNRLFRKGHKSQYRAENVCIASGGRVALTRTAASLGEINLGHFLPDYTAYEELLGLFRAFVPIPILLDPDRGYDFSLEALRREIMGRGLGALLLSNPCNPTGKLVCGESLQAWVATARKLDCTLLLDEFYSHYIWRSDIERRKVSAAEFIEDVDRDPCVLFDGLTKNWRYPGWRISWTLGPKKVIEALSSAGSFLDGGAPRPLQRQAIALLEEDHATAEIDAIQRTFGHKRQLMLTRLQAMGVTIERPPDGTFYVWGSVRSLPEPISTGMRFFRHALKRQVITVPGEFFGVNPGKRRVRRGSRFRHHLRFSFGPEEAALVNGLDRLEALVQEAARGELVVRKGQPAP